MTRTCDGFDDRIPLYSIPRLDMPQNLNFGVTGGQQALARIKPRDGNHLIP